MNVCIDHTYNWVSAWKAKEEAAELRGQMLVMNISKSVTATTSIG